jgi:hypothetical protein
MVTIEHVRNFLNDRVDVNRLLDDFQFSEDRINSAKELVLMEWNTTPPIINNYTIENFPYDIVMLYGIVSYLLLSEAFSEERNHLPYQAGGITVDDSSHAQAYLSFKNMIDTTYKNQMDMHKKSENEDSGWGIISGGYDYYDNDDYIYT